jgi:hypothetical protein
MDEPSVLDYVKSKLAFWKHSSIEIPQPAAASQPPAPAHAVIRTSEVGEAAPAVLPEEEHDQAVTDADLILDEDALPVDAELAASELAASELAATELAASELAAPAESAAVSVSGLLLIMGALLSALVAQSFLEPPTQAGLIGTLLYCFSAVLMGLAYFQHFVIPMPTLFEDAQDASFRIRWEGLAIGLGLMAAAFFTFASEENQIAKFNFFNTSIWLLSIGYLAWAFYQIRPRTGPKFSQRLSRFFAQPRWKITITREMLLAAAVITVILFFRFYRLAGVPLEMVSDHAEKLLDVNDVLNGDWSVFFPRNTGREFFQFYWTALMVKLFPVGISFLALKLGTTLVGLWTLYYIYRLANEFADRRVAVLAVLFAGFSYWANIQSRIGLRFPLYPGFLAPVLFHLIRGLRTSNRNDFIWAGLWMGLGLHGYTSFRIVPLVVVAVFIIYMLHHRTAEKTRFALFSLLIVGLISLAVFLPLLRFTLDHPKLVMERSLTRLGEQERALPGSPLAIFLQNNWNALTMFFWKDGDVWVHSIANRPALDVISAALFFLGLVLVVLRYLRKRTWVDLALVLIIPLLLLPSTLALAFPNENPNLNRTAGAYIPVFVILGLGLDALLGVFRRSLPGRMGRLAATTLALVLLLFSASTNFDLVFNQYDRIFRESAWNTSEMGTVIRNFDAVYGVGRTNAWVVAFPYWVDTRLVGINAGYPTRDTAINPDQVASTMGDPHARLFMINPQDDAGLIALRQIYPDGRYWIHHSEIPSKDFIVFLVQPDEDLLPAGKTEP